MLRFISSGERSIEEGARATVMREAGSATAFEKKYPGAFALRNEICRQVRLDSKSGIRYIYTRNVYARGVSFI